jgi:hypothetical protein
LARKELLFDVESRFYDGLRELRPGRGDDVLFAAIVGIPTDLVDGAARKKVDWEDASSRDTFYADLLRDPRMQQQVDPSTDMRVRSGDLLPSCARQVAGEASAASAYPPRRIVELAKLFGENSAVQSICQEDLAPAVDAIADLIQTRFRKQ